MKVIGMIPFFSYLIRSEINRGPFLANILGYITFREQMKEDAIVAEWLFQMW
jgi:hypothetical protein